MNKKFKTNEPKKNLKSSPKTEEQLWSQFSGL